MATEEAAAVEHQAEEAPEVIEQNGFIISAENVVIQCGVCLSLLTAPAKEGEEATGPTFVSEFVGDDDNVDAFEVECPTCTKKNGVRSVVPLCFIAGDDCVDYDRPPEEEPTPVAPASSDKP